MKFATFAILAVLFTSSAQAGLYKCKGSAGKISYQAEPCAGAAEVTKLRREASHPPAPVQQTQQQSAAATTAKTHGSAEAEFQRRRSARLEAEAAAAKAESDARREAVAQQVQQAQLDELTRLRHAAERTDPNLITDLQTGKRYLKADYCRSNWKDTRCQ
jgi:hypothetical protein